MKIQLSIRDLISHPVTVASTTVAVLGGLLKVPLFIAIWGALYASAGQLFGVLAAALLLSDYVPVLNTSWLVVPVVVVGTMVLHRRATSWYESFKEKLRTQK